MNRSPMILALSVGLLASTSLELFSAPVLVAESSFEINAAITTAGEWDVDLSPEWAESGGVASYAGFEEWITGFSADGDRHLGMNIGHSVWQDLAVTFQANTIYTLTVAVGHRGGDTASGNVSTYSLQDSTGSVWSTGSYDAFANVATDSFADAPDVVFDTTQNPSAVGLTIRIALDAGGNGRSHFDHVRLDAVTAVPPGTASLANSSATAISASAAQLNGQVTDIGDAAPSITIFYGDEDGGFTAAGWELGVHLSRLHLRDPPKKYRVEPSIRAASVFNP